MLATDTQIGWQDYVTIVLRRRWFFIVPCAAVVALTLLIGLVLPKYYRAETLLLVEDQKVINPLIQGLAVSTPVAERMRTLREELLSWTSLNRLVHELHMDRQARDPVTFERLIKRLQREIQVRMRGPDLLIVAYEDRSPKLAQTLVNTITTIYMDRNVESQSAEAKTAITFLESEMAVYKKKLEDSERALRDFKELYVTQMPVATELNQQIIDLEVQLARMLVEDTDAHPTVLATTRQIAALKRKRNDEIKQVITTALARGQDPALSQDLIAALDATATPTTPQDPRVQTAKEAYQGWVDRLDSLARAPSAQTAAPQVQVVATTSSPENKSLEFIGPGTISSISLGPREEQQLARLRRDYEVQSRTYQEMQQRAERAKITQRLGDSDEGTKFKILEPARLPLRPVRPNLLKLFVFSLVIGVFVGAGAAFVAEYLDQSFQSAEDLQATVALPVLGSISTIVTEQDLEARRQRRQQWVSWKAQVTRLKTYVISPIWARVDRTLVRWGL